MSEKDDDDTGREHNGPVSPHDAYFKAVLGEPRNAGVILRERLPEDIVALLAPDLPEPVPGTFIDEQLRPHISDLLYRLRLKSGETALLYALLEHKSTPDALTPLQLLRYMTRIWSKWTRQGEERAGQEQTSGKTAHNGPLPVIIPLVFYHGKRRWNVPRHFAGLFGRPPDELARYIPDFPYEFVDLGHIPDADLSRDPRLRALLMPPKHIFDDDWFAALLEAIDLLLALDPMDVILWMNYIVAARRDFGRRQADQLLRRLPPSQREDIMGSLAQEWLDEGYKRGRAEGEAKGRAELLMRLLERRFGPLPQAVKDRIAAARPDTLELWGDRVLDAASLDDVFEKDTRN